MATRPATPKAQEWTLFYDGGCNLCHVSKLRIEKWAERAGQPLRATPLQSDEGIDKGYGMEAMVLETPHGVFYGADAWLELMRVSPWPLRPIAWMRLTRPTRAIAKFFYGIVAKYRIKLFGSRECSIADRRAAMGATTNS